MSSRRFLVVLLAVALVIGAVGSAHAVGSYLTALSAACPGTSCTSCHGPSGPPPFTAYGTAFSGISSHSSNPSGAIATLGCPGGAPTPTPTPTPAACTGYTYSAWSACGANGQQTRTTTGKTPSGCTGTPSASPVLTQACTPAPVACTGYTYSAWSACGANGQQTRTITGNTPSGCTGTPSASAVLSQACTPSPVACTSFTYGNWTPCDPTGHQTRTATGVPAGCTGTPNPAQLTQICNYVPPTPTPTPPPAGGNMAVPTSQEVFSYAAVAQPVVSGDPGQAKPIGVGPVATGGHTIDVNVQIGPFASPVNVSFMVYAPTLESEDLYFMSSHDELKRLSEAVQEEGQYNMSPYDRNSGDHENHDSHSYGQFGKLSRWKNNVTGVDADIFTASVRDLPSGVYTLVLVVKSSDNEDHYYRWITHVTIP